MSRSPQIASQSSIGPWTVTNKNDLGEPNDCETCLELQHENCDEDCEYCRAQARNREVEEFCNLQSAYYAGEEVPF